MDGPAFSPAMIQEWCMVIFSMILEDTQEYQEMTMDGGGGMVGRRRGEVCMFRFGEVQRRRRT